MKKTKNKAGRPRSSDKTIHAKKMTMQEDLTKLQNIHISKRTVEDMRKIASISSYIHRITRRQRTGRWGK